MKGRWPIGLLVGLLVVLMPPVGLPCLWIYCMRDRQARRSAGEATESVSEMVRATHIATGSVAEPRRPRETERWTQVKDYVRG